MSKLVLSALALVCLVGTVEAKDVEAPAISPLRIHLQMGDRPPVIGRLVNRRRVGLARIFNFVTSDLCVFADGKHYALPASLATEIRAYVARAEYAKLTDVFFAIDVKESQVLHVMIDKPFGVQQFYLPAVENTLVQKTGTNDASTEAAAWQDLALLPAPPPTIPYFLQCYIEIARSGHGHMIHK